MLPLYIFIVSIVLTLVLIPVNAWFATKRYRSSVDYINLLHGAAICGVVISFVWMISTVVWDAFFTLVY